MIINSSRYQLYRLCAKKAFNKHHRRLGTLKGTALVDGSGMHEGIAVGQSTGDWTLARARALELFDSQLATSTILPEEQMLADDHRAVVAAMIEAYRFGFEGEPFTVLRSEVEFEVDLPESEHNCIFLHSRIYETNEWEECVGEPPAELILQKKVHPFHLFPDPQCFCWTPHKLKGKTDGIIQWQNSIWLQEHKSNSIGEKFWLQWDLDVQPTIYIYGIWRALGIKPVGVIINCIHRPSENQVSAWNAKRKGSDAKQVKDYIRYERRAFLRPDQDLARQERDLIDTCNEWEGRIASGYFPMSNVRGICTTYNRLCEYHGCCVGHDEAGTLEGFIAEPDDYIQARSAELVQVQMKKVEERRF